MTNGLVKVRFLKTRGRRAKGDVVSYDPVSAATIVDEGAAEYVKAPDSVDPKPVAGGGSRRRVRAADTAGTDPASATSDTSDE